MIIYLAGKMSGLPDYGRAQFKKAEEALSSMGNIVLNPACLPIGLKEHSYMPIGLAMLNEADAIFLIKGWEKSKGAKLEKKFAEYQGKAILYGG